MRRLLFVTVAIASSSFAALAAPAGLRLDQWAGRYTDKFMSGSVGGGEYEASNQVEIRPVNASHADVALSLEFYNGHSCWIEGRAKVEGRRLVLSLPEMTNYEDKPCRLELWRTRSQLHWSDGDNTCKSACGARGTFSQGSIPLRSKRPLPAKPLDPEG